MSTRSAALLLALALAAPAALAAEDADTTTLRSFFARSSLPSAADRKAAREAYGKLSLGTQTSAQYLRNAFAKDLLGGQLDVLDDAKVVALLRAEPRSSEAVDLLNRVLRVQRHAAAKPDEYKALYLATRPYCDGTSALLVSGEAMALMDVALLPATVEGALEQPVSLGYAASSCLFSRAEHFTDPKAWELMARWDSEPIFDRGIGRGLARWRSGDRDQAPELRSQRVYAKAWLGGRMMRSYQQPAAPAQLTKDAQYVLDSARDFSQGNNSAMAVETLRAGARYFKSPAARAEYSYALGRYLMADLQNEAAAAALADAMRLRTLKPADQGIALQLFGLLSVRQHDEAALDALLAELIAAYKAKGWEQLLPALPVAAR